MSNAVRMAHMNAALDNIDITQASRDLFFEFARDAINWNGQPLVNGNVQMSREQRGNLTQLKRAGLLTTDTDEGCIWVQFTEVGVAFARLNGEEMPANMPMDGRDQDGGCSWCGRDCPDAGKPDGCWYTDCPEFPHGE